MSKRVASISPSSRQTLIQTQSSTKATLILWEEAKEVTEVTQTQCKLPGIRIRASSSLTPLSLALIWGKALLQVRSCRRHLRSIPLHFYERQETKTMPTPEGTVSHPISARQSLSWELPLRSKAMFR